MVINNSQLDAAYQALSDGSRREIIQRLLSGEARVGEFVEPLAMSQPAVSKHIKVLEAASLIRVERRGRETWLSLNADQLENVADWTKRYVQIWRQTFNSMDQYLKEKKRPKDGCDV